LGRNSRDSITNSYRGASNGVDPVRRLLRGSAAHAAEQRSPAANAPIDRPTLFAPFRPWDAAISSVTQILPDDTSGPSAPWLAAAFLLTGLGTVLLGPLLPSLARDWQLSDAQSGLLLFAKFAGAFLGGVTVPSRLRLGIFAGTVLACLGFGGFAVSHSLLAGCLTLFVGGIGLGQIIASTNILAGRRYRTHTGSALASLNFFWSLGAVLTGLLVAAVLPRFGLRNPLLWLATFFLVTGIGGLVRPVAVDKQNVRSVSRVRPIPVAIIIFFAVLLFLYGGLETCLTAWITTFTLRLSDLRLLGGQSGVILMWTALTAGRALASLALRFAAERTVQRVGLAFSVVFIAMLSVAHHGRLLSLCCILVGLSLAPFFPTTFALLMHYGPSARIAGFILAVSGLGAALFPWLMGIISTHIGSLRVAMAVPWTIALALLLLTLVYPEASVSDARFPFQTDGEI
jgi:fucose permease